MAEVFAVETVLELRSNVGPILRELSEQFRELDRLVKTTSETIGGLARVLGDLKQSAGTVGRLATEMERVGRVNFAGLAAGEAPLKAIADNMERIGKIDADSMRQFSQAMGKMATADLAPAAREVNRIAGSIDNAVAAERRLEQAAGQAAQALARQSRAAATPTGVAQGISAPANVQRQTTATEATAKAAKDAAAAMERIAKVDFSRAVSGAEKLAQAMDTTAQAASRVTNNAQQVADAWSNAAKSAKDAADAMKTVTPPRGGRGGGGAAASALPHGEKPIGEHDWLLASIAAQTVADKATEGVRAAFDPAATEQSMEQLLRTDKRVTDQQIQHVRDVVTSVALKPFGAGGVPGMSIDYGIGAVRDLKQLTGDLTEATDAYPAFAKLASLINIVSEKQTGRPVDQVFAAGKVMEILGKMATEHKDPVTGNITRTLNMDELMQNIDRLSQVELAFGGRVNPAMYLQFAKQGDIAGMLETSKFFYEDLPQLLLTQGGQRTATALMDMVSVFHGGHLTAKSLAAMEQYGLAAPGAIKETKQRDPVTGRLHTRELVDATKVYDYTLMGSDPLQYVINTIDRLNKQGIKSTDAQIDVMLKVFQRMPMGRIMAELLKDIPVFKRDEQTVESIRPDAFKFLEDNSIQANLQALNAAFENFKTIMGMPAMKDALGVLQMLTNVLNSISSYLNKPEHQALAKFLTEMGTAAAAAGTILAGVTTTIWLTGPALKMFDAMLMKIIATARAMPGVPGGPSGGGGGKWGPRASIALGIASVGAAAAGAPTFIQNGFTGAMLGSTVGSLFGGPFGAVIGGVAGGVGGMLWDLDPFGENRQAAPPSSALTPKKGDSASNPLYVYGTNQPTGKDIRDGVSRGQADQLSLPSSQPSWFDPSMGPGMQPNPIGP